MIADILGAFGYCLLPLVFYVLFKSLRMYYIYCYYKYYCKVPVPDQWPLPLIGHGRNSMKARLLAAKSKYPADSGTIYKEIAFNGREAPKVFFDFRYPEGVLTVTDPEFMHELYISKNKYFSKHDAHRHRMYPLFGDGILFSPSNADWSIRRKHISAAFYKEKLVEILATITTHSNRRVNQWIHQFGNSGKVMTLTKEVSTLLMEAVEMSVFGIN